MKQSGYYKPFLLALLTNLSWSMHAQNEHKTYVLDPANLSLQLRQAAEQDDVVLLNVVWTIRPFDFLLFDPGGISLDSAERQK